MHVPAACGWSTAECGITSHQAASPAAVVVCVVEGKVVALQLAEQVLLHTPARGLQRPVPEINTAGGTLSAQHTQDHSAAGNTAWQLQPARRAKQVVACSLHALLFIAAARNSRAGAPAGGSCGCTEGPSLGDRFRQLMIPPGSKQTGEHCCAVSAAFTDRPAM